MKVYQAIAAVQSALAKTGIAKGRKASGGGATYAFRGIDDVYSNLAPLLAEHKLCIIPRVLTRDCTERQSKNGGNLFYTTVHAEFDFVSAEDGTKHTAATFGEAMDSSDKSTNKAMSAAYKYAAFMTFCIPVEGDNDTENSNHEVEPRGNSAPQPIIDDAQFATLQTLVEQSGTDAKWMCDYYKVEALNRLTVAQYDHARRNMEDVIANRQKKAA